MRPRTIQYSAKRLNSRQGSNNSAFCFVGSLFSVLGFLVYLGFHTSSSGNLSSNFIVTSHAGAFRAEPAPSGGLVIHLAVVACGKDEDLHVLIKSIMYHFDPRNTIHLYIFHDDDTIMSETNPNLRDTLISIPYLHLYEYDVHNIGISDDHLNLFRKCAGARLSFPILDVLSHVDKLIYLDYDTLVLRDVADLWSFFSHFNSSQHSAMTQQATKVHMYGWYLSPAGANSVCEEDDKFYSHHESQGQQVGVCVPFYGTTGLNSGIYLMYLERMRELQPRPLYGELMEIIQGPAKANHHKFQLGDQDVLNYYFYFNPDQLYELPCEFNVRTDSFCRTRPAVLHGNRHAFHWGNQANIYTETWSAYDQVRLHSLIQPLYQ